MWDLEVEEQDRKSEETPEARTMRLLQEVSNHLVEGLKFTVDLPENHQNQKCPMLDVQVWLEKVGEAVKVRHTFFEKSMTSPLVFHARSA